jgi:hypothetical protein
LPFAPVTVADWRGLVRCTVVERVTAAFGRAQAQPGAAFGRAALSANAEHQRESAAAWSLFCPD